VTGATFDAWPWLTLAMLGAYHGLNPGMGWLFAVALGLQERSRAAVVRAFAPIALGHAASIAAVVALVWVLQAAVSPTHLKYAGAGLLIAFGLYKLLAPMSHPRWVGMRVGFRDLTVWSFLMATAHGAGLMLVPVLFRLPAAAGAPSPTLAAMVAPATRAGLPSPSPSGRAWPAASAAAPESPMPECHTAVAAASADAGRQGTSGRRGAPLVAIAAVGLHTGAMLGVMALIALAVYEKVGLAVLRRAWFNLDLVWAAALIAAGVLTLVL
jgi:hypothetical protein